MLRCGRAAVARATGKGRVVKALSEATRKFASSNLTQTPRDVLETSIRGRGGASVRVSSSNIQRLSAHNPINTTQQTVNVCGPSSRWSGAAAAEAPKGTGLMPVHEMGNLRNIGISAHIDSGKTTLSERILYYTGKIDTMHDIKEGEGATMDSEELERERGITIKSAATFVSWRDLHINLIDTPGHVDFTIEVERALKVMDGAVLVICSVGGVQSQTLTVDRQMRRYDVPRLVFINKCDRLGARPFAAVEMLRNNLDLNAAVVQIPIGLEGQFEGVVDLIKNKAYYFEGAKGKEVVEKEVPEHLRAQAAEYRQKLIETLADIDEGIADKYLEEADISESELHAAIRKATIELKFAPVFMGSAYKNKGVQPLLDGVVNYLPDPKQRKQIAFDTDQNETEVQLECDPKKPFVGLAFKVQQSPHGQLTWMRVYQGSIRKGDIVNHVRTGARVKVPRLVRLHAKDMEPIEEIGPGEICALFGVDCNSGDSFTSPKAKNLVMSSMFIPEPVMSVGVQLKDRTRLDALFKATAKYVKEDPTFHFTVDGESGQMQMRGMGELHLEIYCERLRREENVNVSMSKPYVAYRETLLERVPFEITYKRQSGGAGQFAKIKGYLEPLPFDSPVKYQFENHISGDALTNSFITAVRKAGEDCCNAGQLLGHPIWYVKLGLEDGQMHDVDSSELAFRTATIMAFEKAFKTPNAAGLLEPIMRVDITVPAESFSATLGDMTKRDAMLLETLPGVNTSSCVVEAPLSEMFGYAKTLRSMTSGKGEFSMEYSRHQPMPKSREMEVMREYGKKK